MADTFAGSRIYIGTTLAASSQTEFEADSYVEILDVSNMGELGAVANIVQFPVVSDDFVKKSKGTRNAGDPALVVGRLPNDPGQIAVRAAEATKYFYNFKLELADAINEDYTNTVIYFRALVAGIPVGTGGNEDFVVETYTLGIYPRPVIIESENTTP
jgi:hypothetical protein